LPTPRSPIGMTLWPGRPASARPTVTRKLASRASRPTSAGGGLPAPGRNGFSSSSIRADLTELTVDRDKLPKLGKLLSAVKASASCARRWRYRARRFKNPAGTQVLRGSDQRSGPGLEHEARCVDHVLAGTRGGASLADSAHRWVRPVRSRCWLPCSSWMIVVTLPLWRSTCSGRSTRATLRGLMRGVRTAPWPGRGASPAAPRAASDDPHLARDTATCMRDVVYFLTDRGTYRARTSKWSSRPRCL